MGQRERSGTLGIPALVRGCDGLKQEYMGLWMDSMSTWWIESRGQAGEEGVIEMAGTMRDMVGERPFRMVTRHVTDDHWQCEMYDTIPPHGEIVVMKFDSKRVR